jgi:predicted RNA-binding protein with PUA-like domain
MVDVKYIRHTQRVIPLSELKAHAPLENMPLVRRGNRLSIMPVSKSEWEFILSIEDSTGD